MGRVESAMRMPLYIWGPVIAHGTDEQNNEGVRERDEQIENPLWMYIIATVPQRPLLRREEPEWRLYLRERGLSCVEAMAMAMTKLGRKALREGGWFVIFWPQNCRHKHRVDVARPIRTSPRGTSQGRMNCSATSGPGGGCGAFVAVASARNRPMAFIGTAWPMHQEKKNRGSGGGRTSMPL